MRITTRTFLLPWQGLGIQTDKLLCIGQNNRRRHLTKDQLAVVGESLANLRWGSNQYQDQKEESQIVEPFCLVPSVYALD